MHIAFVVGWAMIALGLIAIILSIWRISVYQKNSMSGLSISGRLVGFIREFMHIDHTLFFIAIGFLIMCFGIFVLGTSMAQ